MEGRCLVSLEGNIAAGKSSVLEYLEQVETYTILKEPIQEWENFGGVNVLELKYAEGAELEFQFLATMSRMNQLKNVRGVVVQERSFSTSHNIFTS